MKNDQGNAIEDLPWAVDIIQQRLSTPIAIDSDNPKAIRAALARCKPDIPVMINSISAENIDSLMPQVLHYAHLNLAIIVIAKPAFLADKKLESIKPLVDRVLEGGIQRQKIYIDPGVLAIGASQKVNNGCETLAAIAKIRADEFFSDMHITGGFSNVSFQMPDRPLINRTFIAMAMALGADSGLINPLEGANKGIDEQPMPTLQAAKLIYANKDVLFAWAKTTNVLPSDQSLEPLVEALDEGDMEERLRLIKKTLIPMLMVWEALKQESIGLKSELEPYVGYDAELRRVVEASKAAVGNLEDIRNYVHSKSGEKKQGVVEFQRMQGFLGEMQVAIIEGQEESVAETTSRALEEEGRTPQEVIGCIGQAMKVVGARFNKGEYFMPQMLAAANVSAAIIDVLQPYFKRDAKAREKIIIATVKGDMHDIGKNIVAIMLKGAGFEVIDLGVDVDADTVVARAVAEGAKLICLSALLDTTRDRMVDTVELLEAKGLQDDIKVLIGGASVTEEFAKRIDASYGEDAFVAVAMAKELLQLP
jgi:5-methyltetrahydrofolate--homocysteine methyltransferase